MADSVVSVEHESNVSTVELRTDVVVLPSDKIVTTVEERPVVITDEMRSYVAVEKTDTVVVAEGQQGPAGPPGPGGGAIFILDVTPTATGIVGNKSYVNGTPELATCVSDTTEVRVFVGCEGGEGNYKPSVTINGVTATLVESATTRWFEGYADVVLLSGGNIIAAVSDTGSNDITFVEVLGAGPNILSMVFGSYPGSQTELKQGDVVTVTVTTDLAADSVTILGQGAADSTTLPVVAGVASGPITISGASGAQAVTAKAKNSFGTFGAQFVSSALTLNQTYPVIGGVTVSYPFGQGALNTGDNGTASCTILDADVVAYSSPHLSITNPNTYAPSKTVTPSFNGYEGSGTNYFISATRTANNATTTSSGLVKIATVAPSASIAIVPSGRLSSSPSGVSYDVRITPNQALLAAPTLDASLGTWSGAWVAVGSYWHRPLLVNDGVARGAGSFSNLVLTGLSGIAGTSITSGASYTVGGFSARAVTFPAFSRVAPLGVAVGDATKMTFAVGSTPYTRYTDNVVRATGFYPANADGSYNANGTYVGLSDSVFAGSNTTGTLQGTAQEIA
jgi:hypothetical protein